MTEETTAAASASKGYVEVGLTTTRPAVWVGSGSGMIFEVALGHPLPEQLSARDLALIGALLDLARQEVDVARGASPDA